MLRPDEIKYKVLFEQSADAMLIIDGEQFVDCNQATLKMLGYTKREELFSTHPSKLSPEFQPDGQSSFDKANEMISIAAKNGSNRFEWIHTRANGENFPVEVLLTTIPYEGRDLIHVVWRDITKRKKSEQENEDKENLLTQIIQGCPVPMFVIDKEHKVTHWNKACEAIIGTPAESVIGTTNQWSGFYKSQRPVLADLIMDGKVDRLPDLYKGIWSESPLISGAWEATDHFPNFKNGARWLYFTAAPLQDKNGGIIGAVETLQDITEQKKYETELEHQANHDNLTGIPNRNLFVDRLKQAIAHAKREQILLAVLFFDLDDFKTVNDTLGHNIGDKLLKEVAHRLQQNIRTGDTLARIGGDEFVVLLFGPKDEDHVTDITRRIIAELSNVIDLGDHDLRVRSSIGISLYPQDGTDPDTLLKHADAAMYHAKSRSNGGMSFFTQNLNERAVKRLEIEQGLYEAIEKDQFELHYQPLFNLSRGELEGAEALIRWRHPERGLIPPGDFIEIAEQTGLIIPIGDWVLRTALKEARAWFEEFGKTLRISVNVSAKQFQSNAILKSMRALFKEFGTSYLDLELEVTESIVMKNPESAEAMLLELKEMGARLAMDDFGTGYSSLAYLRRFPFDMVKIDRAFITDLGSNAEAEAIVRAMLDLGTALGLRMVAEGVETEKQLSFLKQERCHEVQGYYLSHPIDRTDFRALLEKGRHITLQDNSAIMI
ncbi:MAG: EAL domain-containing protein [Alphaproteobacteria bacterium]|nr:EAL domain-containing protein [Rhodospirillales bacterium]MCW9045552.1 EAL domain-containing protein [Alphaproteobacteria bacterium]